MTKLYNKASEREKRRSLRRNMPPAERILWDRIRDRQIQDVKFRRQYSVDRFVVDFFSTEYKLAIEIDGDSHFQDGAVDYDQERQAFLESKGINVLRFTNQQVYEQLDCVIELIQQKLQELNSCDRVTKSSRLIPGHPLDAVFPCRLIG